MTKLIFLDTETTGLYPQLGHVPYEIAMVDQAGTQVTLWIHLTGDQLAAADPAAMRIGRYWERIPDARERFAYELPAVTTASLADLAVLGQPVPCSEAVAAWIVVRETAGAHLVGAVPSFDAAMLDAMARRHQLTPAWHYHLVDVETLVAGYLASSAHDQDGSKLAELARAKAAPPWDSNALSNAVGIDPGRFDRHTALGDARWAKAVYDAVMRG